MPICTDEAQNPALAFPNQFRTGRIGDWVRNKPPCVSHFAPMPLVCDSDTHLPYALYALYKLLTMLSISCRISPNVDKYCQTFGAGLILVNLANPHPILLTSYPVESCKVLSLPAKSFRILVYIPESFRYC